MPRVVDPELQGVLRQPFDEQVAFFRAKLGNLVPTESWRDIMRSQHDRAFMVAGASNADLLADLASAVDKAITDGESLDQFRKRFDELVERNGWQGWTGSESAAGRAWRTRVIYKTNSSVAYAAGRRAQLMEFPLWVYRHGGSRDPRPEHLAWDGLVLPRDHPFWATHSPPNGWGCSCYVLGARSERGARRLGGNPDMQLPDDWDTRDTDGHMPGIDEGWDYAPGATVSDDVAEAVARKTVDWPRDLSKAYMDQVPPGLRDALAEAQRQQAETGENLRRYAERALGERNGAPIDSRVVVQPYQTVGLLTEAESAQIARLTGLEAIAGERWDWAIDAAGVRNVNQAARGAAAITVEDYRRLPQLLLRAEAIQPGTADALVSVDHTIGDWAYSALFEARPEQRVMVLRSFSKRAAP